MYEVAWKGSLVLLVWAGADYFLERQRHENELKMSRQDQKDEFKEMEGNPAVKQRIRRLQRQTRRRRMLKDVERAAVVITNPTEFAIALEYRMEMDAPVVVAKGRNLLAAQIKEIARWNGIPMVENPPLAHALYRAVEVGQAIPAKLYTVVAEILAAIWRAQSRAAQASARSQSQTEPIAAAEDLAMAANPTITLSAPAAKPKNAAAEWIMPIAAVGLIFVMLVPMPSLLLDLLLATSMTVSVLVLLSAIQILRPSQFSVFPSLLLLLTLFRLSLNLASSRRILLHGNEGASAAGHVIEAFGQFVVGGNYVVGFVLFVALIAIQYLVVAHGAVRTAEVTARFTLDAMPGKQMAIDADLNAGLINEAQARARREQIAHDAEFYGAMDGAARFNQRDAIATILITAINIIAGFLIGVFQLDIPFREALKTYTVLTVGDGLVTMIPSLLVSMAGGIVVTRASSDATLVGRCRAASALAAPSAGDCRRRDAGPGRDSGAAEVFFLPAGAGTAFLAWRAPKVQPRSRRRGCGRGGGEKKPATGFGRGSAEARRTQPRSRLRAGAAGRSESRRTAAGAGEGPAAESGPAAGLHRSSGAHHRQRAPEAARICHRACAESKSRAGKCIRTTCWPSVRKVRRARWRECQPRSRPSAWPRCGFRRRCRTRRWPRATRWSTRRRCWPRIWPKWSSSTLTNCSPGRKPSACSTGWPKAIPSWSRNWCRRF